MCRARTPPAGRRPFHGPRAIPGLRRNQFGIMARSFRAIWKMNSGRFNLSLGARYEGQTNISDHTQHRPQEWLCLPQVWQNNRLRGGGGRCSIRGSTKKYRRTVTTALDGTRQEQIVIRYPTFCLESDLAFNQRDGYFPTPPPSLRGCAHRNGHALLTSIHRPLEKEPAERTRVTFSMGRPRPGVTCIAAAI